MNAIVVPKLGESKHSDLINVDAIKPTDLASTAPGGHPKDDGASDPVFDVQAALDRAEGNRELLRNMVGLFSIQWRERLAEIASAASRHDGAALEIVANRLKRSLGSVGAAKASRVAEELEELGCKRRFHDSKKGHARLENEIERLVKALETLSKGVVPTPGRRPAAPAGA